MADNIKDTENSKKAEKKIPAKKLPRIFKKTYTDKKFKKKILKKLYVTEYKTLIEETFTEKSYEHKIEKKEFTRDEMKKLKEVAKSVKKNTGAVQKGKLMFLAILLGGIFLFNFFLKDKLIEDSAESAFRDLFQGQSDFKELKFQPEQGRLTFETLLVADQGAPMRNLFELGKTELKLSVPELLKGKFIIENIECKEIQWGTERTSSGALTKQVTGETTVTEDRSAADQPPLFDFAKIDPEKIIKEQEENIKTLKLSRQFTETLGLLKEKWTAETASYNQELTTIMTEVDKIKNLDFSGFNSLESIVDSYNSAKGLVSRAKTMGSRITETKEKIEKDIRMVDNSRKEITEAFEEDYNKLQEFMRLPDTEKQSIIARVASGYLEKELGPLYTYSIKALEIIKMLSASKKSTGEGLNREGEKIYFPEKQYPDFLLKQASVSFGNEETATSLTLENLSSSRELTGKPVTFSAGYKDPSYNIKLKGSVDLLKETPMTLAIESRAIPLTFKEGMDFLGAKSFTGNCDILGSINVSKDSSFSGKLTLEISTPRITKTSPNHLLGKVLDKLLNKSKAVNITASFSSTSEGVSIEAVTNLDELINERIGGMVKEMVDQAQRELRKKLTELLESELKKNENLYEAFKYLEKSVNGNWTDIKSYEKLITEKTGELKEWQTNFQKKTRETLMQETEDIKNQVTDKIDSIKDLKNNFGF